MTTAPPTRAVANLHLHLEYDSGLDVIAAAMASVSDGGDADTDEHRAHVSEDISAAIAHLLDVDALAPEGCPVRVTEVQMEVTVDIDDHSHEVDALGSTPEELAEFEEDALEALEAAGFTDDEMALIAQAHAVTDSAGPPPFELSPANIADIPRFIADWGVACGYLARACETCIDDLFDDLAVVSGETGAAPELANLTGWLPEEWESEYTPAFYRRFIVTMTDVTTAVVAGWEGPATVAQALAMAYLVESIESLKELTGVRVPRGMLETLRGRLVDEDVVAAVLAGVVDFEEWFVPFGTEPSAPYATDF